jgi:hypothetical protein
MKHQYAPFTVISTKQGANTGAYQHWRRLRFNYCFDFAQAAPTQNHKRQ